MTTNKHFLRGMATVNFWADDVAAARDWYGKLFGVDAYFQMPSKEAPAYVEFRIGDDAAHARVSRRRDASPRRTAARDGCGDDECAA